MTANKMTASQSASENDMQQALLARFELTEAQRAAALERARNVVVTAGAGSGKTRTLVARYLPLLAECGSPRRIVAITFTDKAAREMRNRIRGEVRGLIAEAGDDAVRQRWIDLESRLDAARISTIHSLCQEILRAHPVEAGLDPQFEVVDENQAALLRAGAVHAALTGAVEDPVFQPLFGLWKAGTLEAVLNRLVSERLDVDEIHEAGGDPNQPACKALEDWTRSALYERALEELRQSQAQLAANGGDKFSTMALDLLASLEQAQDRLRDGHMGEAALALFTARRQQMKGTLGKAGPLKTLVKELRESYDTALAWLGGSGSNDPAPDPEVEARMSETRALLFSLYARARDAYLAALRSSNRVDFNDLEGKTYDLLRRPEVAVRWQAEIDWVLVDEFQDTNARQREIVRALCGDGPRHKLFIVGDARQSIYRFRGADVTVFRDLRGELQREGGLLVDLDCTFRAHGGLLAALGDLLEPMMNRAELMSHPFHVPYAALSASHAAPERGAAAPFVEFVLGSGRDSPQGRQAAARALARRLLALKSSGQIRAWSEVTLLFRASTGFPVYEDAFEACGIPYVTVAGQGFYDRPEIRDVVNLLRALADPWDDLALAGLLCSPAFGLSQAGLASLNWKDGQKMALYPALQGKLSGLDDADRAVAERASAFLAELLPWVDRVPVAELLQRVVNWTHYRAILAAGSHRLWRNLDKLLADAQASGSVQVQAFLEYLGTLKDVGAREGEAAAEAAGAEAAGAEAAGAEAAGKGGAVRLMTIHKSKGLEFEFVVLADAARSVSNPASSFYRLPETGLTFRPDRIDSEPLAYRYAKALNKSQAESEDCRLLYVALTRAKEKVLISGHYTDREAQLSATGWLKDLLGVAGFDLDTLARDPQPQYERGLPCGQPVSIWADRPDDRVAAVSRAARVLLPVEAGVRPLFTPILDQDDAPAGEDEPDLPIWRATGQDGQVVGQAIGKMVHRAIQRWRFPGDPGLENLIDAVARESGVVAEAERSFALQEAAQCLNRFRAHPLWATLDQAARLHEVPYTLLRGDGVAEVGYIDLLYQAREGAAGWSVVDFKTDTIQSEADLDALVARYTRQARRYTRAVRSLLGRVETVSLCFLDACGRVAVVEV